MALSTWGAHVHAQAGRNSTEQYETEHQRQYAEAVADAQPARDRNTAAQTATGTIARIKMSSDDSISDLRQTQPRSQRRSVQPPPKVSSIRFASFEADLAPARQVIKNLATQNQEYSIPERRTAVAAASQNDMAPIKQAFNSFREPAESSPQSPIAEPSQSSTIDTSLERDLAAEQALLADLKSRGKSQDEPAQETETASAETLGIFGQDGSRELFERIAYNTMFVLAFGVGFIFVARVWIKPTAAKANEKQSQFEVLSTLKLPGKSNLMLVKVDSERLMVALDQTGVKSVVHLSDSFADKLEAYSDMPDEVAELDFPPRRPAVEREPESPVYSMDAVRKERPKKTVRKKVAERPVDAAKNTEAIREQMEAALLKFGLKGLV